jgi:tetratricopeptide (TPR) repeat protein
LAGFVIALAAAAHAGGAVTIKGKVIDRAGDPMADVAVTAVAVNDPSLSYSGTTNKKGAFSIRVKDWDLTYLITASKEGFVEATTRIQKSPSDEAIIHMTLISESEAAEEAAAAAAAPAQDPATERRNAAIVVFNEGVDALQADDSETALVKFQEATQIDPEFMEAQRGVAAAAMKVGQYSAAADAAEKILEIDPENEEAMGTAYLASLFAADTDRLVKAADRLATYNPAVAATEMLQHAAVLFEQNENERARILLEVIVVHQPDSADAQLQLGLVCNAMGDTSCAKKSLGRFLELAPDHPDAPTATSILEYLN